LESLLWVLSLCLVLGALVGFMAGLLGIGGGLLIVPALLYILPGVGVAQAQVTHIAIATSLAAIILTSLSSARAHQRRGNIPWKLFGSMIPGIVLGALFSGFVAELIPAHRLQQVFALFVILMALQMAWPIKPEAQRQLPTVPVLFGISLAVALIAGLMGIGGGVLLVPILTFYGMQMRYAIGFSSISGLIIALSGTLGYIMAGWNSPELPPGTLGFIYLPALLGIVMTSMWTAPLGVKMASIWPTLVLKKVFSLFLFVVGLKLVLG
jgi:uncharacterized protein